MQCPCCSQLDYEQCCGLYLEGHNHAPSPLTLMRSRYTAFVLSRFDYIAQTMRPPASHDFDSKSAEQSNQGITWRELKIVTQHENDLTGQVEFIATYQLNKTTYQLHELSDFKKMEGHWFYIKGTRPKSSRNALCPCGSGKKVKKCCS